MRVDRALRWSIYLTLGLACGSLGYAELSFLPAMPWILLGVAGLLVLAFCLDGRWLLPVWAANVLGAVIVAGSLAWLARLYVVAEREVDTATGDLPWPAAALPHLGPMLMALMVVKLLRLKAYADYWLVHTVGFLQVALACVLTGEPLFGLLLWCYLACSLWCLMLLQAGPALATGRPEANRVNHRPSAAARPVRVPWRLLGLGRALRGALVCGLLGLLLFLVLPRHGDLTWDAGHLTWAGRGQPQTGLPGTMDLKQTGTVKVSEEKAFEVTVTEGTVNGRPKLNLSPYQLWRSRTLDRYLLGRWTNSLPFDLTGGAPMPANAPPQNIQPQQLPSFQRLPKRFHENKELPNLGPGQYVISFNINPRKLGGLVLAEPIILGPGLTDHPYEAYPTDPGPLKQLFYETDGTLNAAPTQSTRQATYIQVTAPPLGARPRVSVPRWFRETARGFPPPGDEMRNWTRRLLQRLAAERRYGLTPAHLAEGPLHWPLQAIHTEAVARALCDYLATSGDYTYSLDLRREDRRLDPTLDFLRNVKEGHCQRFAGALALMLRSQGIPTRVVLGFRGAEHLGEGRYIVRQSHAHAWVEALVPLEKECPEVLGASAAGLLGSPGGWSPFLAAAAFVPGRPREHWLTLDPTPARGDDTNPDFTLAGFWQGTYTQLRQLWLAFVVDFNPDNQRFALLSLWEWLAPGERLAAAARWTGDAYTGQFWTKPGFWILTLTGGGLLFWMVRRFRWGRRGHSPTNPGVGVAFYARLLAIVGRQLRLRPGTGQTPREFGATVGDHLRAAGTPEDLAELPGRLAGRFYQVRFGKLALPDEELQAIDAQLDQLEKRLTQPAPSTTGR
jgi:hypothetical protein